MINLAKKSLVGKAKERPDLVKEVVTKARNDGLRSTYRSVRSRLEEPIPLGYSCAGEVIATGDDVTDIAVGEKVACGGAGYATHSEINVIPANLCTPVPETVSLLDAAFTTVGAIAMQGVRRLEPTPGERIAIIGLGLVGRLTAKILDAYGHPTLGIDIDETAVENADELTAGAVIDRDDVKQMATEFSASDGVDGVIITAATDSNQPITLAGAISREQGRISVVGDVGMDVPRDEYYEKELDVRLSRSYGPGRYDRTYEEVGLDYPIKYVRWTENRNMAEFLRLLEQEDTAVDDLVTHTFPFDEALDAYDLILNGSDYTGIVFEYDQRSTDTERSRRYDRSRSKRTAAGTLSLGIVGAGNFATTVLLPVISDLDGYTIDAVASATGTSSAAVAEKYDARYATTDYEEIIQDDDIDVVVVATRHNLHAEIAGRALEEGKDVHVEKPPALTRAALGELASIEQQSDGRLMVGYNRRFSKPVRDIKQKMASATTPSMVQYRVNADTIPDDHWTLDPDVGGGRIIGEVCHFVDLMQYLTETAPTRVYACGPNTDDAPTRQNLQATVEFDDGSTGTITYTTLGDRSLAKEQIEVFNGGAAATIDNFKTGRFGLNQDKGFEAEFRAFNRAITDGDPSPIPIDEIVTTSETTFALRESITSNKPVPVER
ncbi:bi-domain-containing oxidoreductase [Halomicrobium katesii]|uniref:bi-domain-containing oxidoreductase n=1 Tax=Halomicrobium katesii TaxID=437163 RepID=UPI001B7FDF71|nr:bi-domain-containing oxidoreductase [Halomicrobium katesii]